MVKEIVNFTTRHRLFWSLLLVLMLAYCPAWGQTVEEADRAYKDLITMRQDTSFTKDQMYSKAMYITKIYQQHLISTPSGVEGFNKAQSMLKSLYPFIRSGAGYYSQAHQDSIAVVYAQMAVDIAMMPEMQGQGLRNSPDYPNFVYYVASRTYNAGHYEAAIKYLKEYMDVTDPSMHPRVLAYLKEAEHLFSQMQKSKARFQDVNKGVPDFDVFARESIQQGMDKWKQKDPYETVAEYKERVNEETAKKKQKELQDILMEEYVQRFAHKMSITDMQLKPYDADNQSFLIGSPYGDIVLVVPRTNNEARDFAESWSDIKVYNQNFVIANKKLALAGLTFSTPAGKIYNYNNQQALAYNETQVDANFTEDLVDYGKLVNSDGSESKAKIGVKEVAVGVSDVDINIPEYKKVNDKTFAVIISNENYTLVPPVPMAGNDGNVFAQYCEKALGLPKENILLYPDATYGKMIRAVQDIKNIADAYNGIRIIFFYAGHGIPNESTRDAFLLPIDADGGSTEVCYPLKKLYSELSAMQATSVVVFLDACFSGTTGEGKTLMASARGVALKARQEKPTGNLVVFSAASDDETAYPYTDRGHGLFTYFLLKKLQETKGNTNLGDLGDFITENVKQKSVLINHKVQTPTVSFSNDLQNSWRKLKLR